MKASAVVRLRIPSKKHSEIIYNALKPETDKCPTTRSKAIIEKSDASLVLKVEAKDTVALRAAVNAYLRWINSLKNVLEVLDAASF